MTAWQAAVAGSWIFFFVFFLIIKTGSYNEPVVVLIFVASLKPPVLKINSYWADFFICCVDARSSNNAPQLKQLHRYCTHYVSIYIPCNTSLLNATKYLERPLLIRTRRRCLIVSQSFRINYT